MALPESAYCINCGARLEAGHLFCWRCGTARWSPEVTAEAPGSGEAGGGPEGQRPPPVPGTPVFQRRPDPAAAPAPAPVSLGLLPWFFAAGAIFFLVWATQVLAVFLSPVGRSELMAEMGRQGFAASMRPGLLVAYGVILIGLAAAAAGLHATAFYGLRRHRRWGWIAALVVAAIWSLLIVGIPVLARLVNRDVRHSFGVD